MAKYTRVPVGKESSFDSDLLLIHERTTTASDRPLLIFLHGFSGHGFDTWKPILRSEWVKQSARFDIGLVNYVSGFKRYFKLGQLSPEAVAHNLATEISQISPRRVVLVGHSMGGLLAKETLRRLHARFGPASVHTRSVIGVVTLCMPATGSGLVNLLPGPAWRDRIVLRKYSQFQRDVDEFFSTWIDVELVGAGRRQLHVPTFGASALFDRIVPAMAAELGLPAHQRTQLSGGHRSSLHHSGTLRWLEKTVDQLIDARLSRARIEPVLSAEFHGTGSHPHWESAYRLALAQFAADRGSAAIGDFAQRSVEEVPDLLVRAYSAQSIPPDVPTEVRTDVERQARSGGRMALGISPIGSMAPAAVEQLVARVNAPRLRWFRAAADNDAEIVAAFREFFDLTIQVAEGRGQVSRLYRLDPEKGLDSAV